MSKFSLKRSSVLKKREDFIRLFKQGKRLRDGNFILSYIVDNEKDSNVLCGFVAPKRYLRKAVHRNRTKRLLREVYRTHKSNIEQLAQTQKLEIKLLVGYNGSEIPNFTECEQKISALILRFETAMNTLHNEK